MKTSVLSLRPIRAVSPSRRPSMVAVVEPSTGDVLFVTLCAKGTSGGLWRLRPGSAEPLALGHEALGFSMDDRPVRVVLHAGKDGQVRALWQLETSWRDRKMLETRWTGERFEATSPVEVSDRLTYCQCAVFDPVRDTLVLYFEGSGERKATFHERRGGTSEIKEAPATTTTLARNGCFSTRLGKMAFLGDAGGKLQIDLWDGTTLETLPVQINRSSQYSTVHLLDGAPFDADLVIVDHKD